MREGWELKKLGEIGKVSMCKRILKKQTLPIGDIPFYKIGTFGKIPNAFIPKKVYEEYRSKYSFPKKGDILLSASGTIGRRVIYDGKPAYFQDSNIVWIANDEKKVLNGYLHKFYGFCNWNPSKGATISRLYNDDLRRIQIPIPPLPEQQQIVALLDQAFEAIDQAKANIEKNIENAKELFQSKLNAVFSQKGEGWEEKTLGEVCNLYQGLAINKKTKYLLVKKSSLPLLRIKDLKNNIEEQYVSETGYPENAKVSADNIIYTRTGSLGLVFRGRTGVLHNNSFKVVPSDELSGDYLYWWLKHDAFTKIIIGLASRAAQPDITHKLFKKQIISIPTKDLQAKYYKQIMSLNDSTNDIVEAYTNKMANLEELKKSILQKAFAGELTKEFSVSSEQLAVNTN